MRYFRVVHAVSSSPNVDVCINGRKVISNISYMEVTSYTPTCMREVTIGVCLLNTDNLLYSRRINLCSEYSTLVITMVDSKLRIHGYKDVRSIRDEGYTYIRLIHLAMEAPSINLDINDRHLISNVSYLGSKESLLKLGTFINRAEVRLDLSTESVASFIITPGNKTVNTLFLFGDGSIESIKHKFVNDNGHIHDKLIDSFDLDAYMNTWFLGAEIPQPYTGGRCSLQTAVYTLLDDGVKVFNICYDENGRIVNTITGKGTIVNPDQPAALRVTFPNNQETSLPNYLVVEFNKHPKHGFAFVYSPGRTSCYLLLRSRKLTDCLYNTFVRRATESGFDSSKIVRYIHDSW